ncbi:MAG: DASS family sodium-coupled anion symporter [bacterium]
MVNAVSFKVIGFWLGLMLFILLLVLPTFSVFTNEALTLLGNSTLEVPPEQLAGSIQIVFALFLLMVIWWITEAVPLPVTALLPPVVLPIFHVVGVQGAAPFEYTAKNVLVNYANPVIYLFLGGFLLAAAMQKWRLDRRMTLALLTRRNLAQSPKAILLGIMSVTAFISMWISNTATAAMMLPLGIGILHLLRTQPGESRFGTALMLGIAWAASIGGVGTIIGTPPNGIALGILNSFFANDPNYHRITFLDWMTFGVPFVLCMIPVAWRLLLLLHPPEITVIHGGKERLLQERSLLGALTREEKLVIGVFLLAVVLWVSNPFWNSLLPSAIVYRIAWIDEYHIGLFVGILCFLIPVNMRNGAMLLSWSDTKFVDWGTLILFGGGIALSDAMFKTGLASWIAHSFIALLGTPSTFILVVGVVLLVDFLTEVTSNTAVTSMMVPIVISISISTGGNAVTLSIAAAVAASMAFMLPVATPPNALVYGTGYVRLKDMVKSGFWLDILGWCVTVGILYIVGDWIFGVLDF